MPPEAQTLERSLDGASKGLARGLWIEASLLGAAGFFLAVLLGALAAWARQSSLSIVGLELTVAVATIAALAYRSRHFLRAEPSSHRMARWLDATMAKRGAVPPSAVRFLSAMELVRDGSKYGESAELTQAAIKEAAERALAVDPPRLVREELSRPLLKKATPGLGVLLLILLVALLHPEHLRSSLGAVSALGTLDKALERLPPEPRLGDFRITYQPPAYSERSPITLNAPNGSLRALPGTEVTIETRARDELSDAVLLLNYGEDKDSEPDRVSVKVEGRRIKVTMVLTKSGRYRFQVHTTEGELQEERRGHEIELEPDNPPQVTLLEPKESPLEVNERDRVSLSFSAEDDFALGEATVAWRVLGSTREGHSRLTSAGSGLRQFSGSGELDLSQLELKPGDRVAYSVELRDNDTVNGPKVGSSETKELRIYSKKVHHAQVMALQSEALDELVHILGDNLDSRFEPKGDKELDQALLAAAARIVERANKADDLLVRTVVAVKKDPMGRPQVAEAFERARVELSRDARRKRVAVTVAKTSVERQKKLDPVDAKPVKAAQEGMVGDLEKNSVYLADLLNDQRMIDAEALAKELRSEQQALRKLLDEYKKAPTEEKRAQLAKAIQDVKNRIQDISKELSQLKSSIPQDYVSPDAMDQEDGAEQMDRIQKMLEEGDLDGAMRTLDKMLGATEEMLSELGEGREEIQSREYSEITEMGRQIWKDLDQLERDQRDLAKRTEGVSKDVFERMKSKLGDAQSFVDRQKKRLEQAKSTVSKARPDSYLPDAETFDMVERRLEDGIRALEAQDFGAAQEVLKQAAFSMAQLEQDAMRRMDQARRFGDFFGSSDNAERTERVMRKARPTVEEVLDELNQLMPPPQSLLNDGEREQLKRFQERQGDLEGRAKQLGKDLEKLGQMLPLVGPESREMLEGARGDMGSAGQSLGGGNAPSALGQERAALDKLAQLKDQLEKMGEGSGKGRSGGVPLPFGDHQGGSPDGREDGRETDPLEKVQIPKPEEYQAPAEFREDLLEAAKQGTVESYRDAVRRYYEELVK